MIPQMIIWVVFDERANQVTAVIRTQEDPKLIVRPYIPVAGYAEKWEAIHNVFLGTMYHNGNFESAFGG